MADRQAIPTQIAAEASAGSNRLFRLVLLTSLSLFNFGYNTASIGGALLYIDLESVNCELESVCLTSSFEKGYVVSSCLLGACFGALVAGSLADRYGRRTVLLANNFFYILGPLGMAMAQSAIVLAAARSLTGIGVGIASALVHLYIGENVPASRRGEYGAILVMMGTGGIFMANLVSYIFGGQWRTILALGMMPGVLQVIFGPGAMPESPCWLRDQELQRQRSAAEMGKIQVHDVEMCLTDGVLEDQTSGGWLMLWREVKSGKAARALLVGAGLQFLQQVSGINVAVYYGPKIFTLTGFSKDEATFLCVCLSGAQMAATLGLARVVDRLGRRPVSLVGIAMMTASLLALSVAFVPDLLPSAEFASWVSVLAMLFFRLAFSISLGPLPFIITAEIFPTSCRTSGVSLCWFVNWVSNFAMSLAFPPMLQVLDAHGTFFLCACVCILAFIFVKFCVQETRGQTACAGAKEVISAETAKSESMSVSFWKLLTMLSFDQIFCSRYICQRCSHRKLLRSEDGDARDR